MSELVFLFVGQSSRDVTMIDRLSAVDQAVGEEVREQIGVADFSTNVGIQESVTTTTLGWLKVLNDRGITSTQSAGLSLGEYAHLVDIGSLQPASCRHLVRRRGELYDAGPRGCMAAIFPCGWEELRPILAAAPGKVAPAVYSSPTQTVIGGDREGVEWVMKAADEALFTMSVMIEEHIPMHTALFEPVASELGKALASVDIAVAHKPYRANVTGEPSEGTPEQIRKSLARHVYEPVRWHRTVDRMLEDFPDATLVEVGPRSVLRDLMKRWRPDVPVFSVDPCSTDPKGAFEEMLKELEVLRG